jgi:hypothetical protein
MLAALPVIYRVTRELDYRYNTPEIASGGIPVDLSAVARSQHESAMGPAAPAAPGLVQILPASSPQATTLEPPSPGQPPAAS